MKEKTKKVVLAIELAVLVLLSAFVVSLFTNESSVGIENQLPAASISADITSGEAPLEVSFTGSGIDTDGIIDSYYWNFGDGTTANTKNPKYIFQQKGEYIVSLTIKDNKGATASDYVTINVEEEPLWVMASARYDNLLNPVAPLWVHFHCKVIGGSGEIVSYYWEFTDKFLNHESNERTPSRVYFFPGFKSARITVTDSEGNTATDTAMFDIKGYVEWYWELITSFFDLLPKRS